jgi:hypothetical protein
MSSAFSGRRDGIDSLDAQFWDERFAANFTPWDHGGVPVELKNFIAQAAAPCATLIPGCGFAHELAYFRNAGWAATAIDFSAAAVRQAQQMAPEWQAHILEADFFEFTPSQPLALIYERAFFCALPPAKRVDIVQRWAQLLAPQGLLVGYFFIEDDAAKSAKKGPPFSITRQHLLDVMASHFTLLEEQIASQPIAVFQGKERWMVWQRR